MEIGSSDVAACFDSFSYDWRSGSPCCESFSNPAEMDHRPSSVDTFLTHHHHQHHHHHHRLHQQDSSRWSSR
ncbi:unnamed protein product [Wuchereria bancrofti]|uniref:Uncharacterized protein n=1 Tax=Wuchereria bancrofti TaxID=6293 RepID=A0A3P7GGJ4_WUCBA|nr:unnamed protein product [Wuchereria bancrofti]